MAGHFELIDAPGGGYRVRLLDASGQVIALSVNYPTVQAAAAGIFVTREIAASGLIRDLSRPQRSEPHQPLPQQGSPANTAPGRRQDGEPSARQPRSRRARAEPLAS